MELRYEAIDNGVARYGLCNYRDLSARDMEAEHRGAYLFEERLDNCILLFDLGQEVFPFARRRDG